jgi:hypothetical protein
MVILHRKTKMQMQNLIKYFASVLVFYFILVPWLICFSLYMACYEVKSWFEWRDIKCRKYYNGVWTEE